jgi:hypothetical protein
MVTELIADTNSLKYLRSCEHDNQSVIPVKTGIHKVKNWIPAGVYPRVNGGWNDSVTVVYRRVNYES